MRLPIQYALSYPDRWPFPEGRIDWSRPISLDFTPPDLNKFPCLRLAQEALHTGGNAPAVLNAANEAAVHLFLNGHLSFPGIPYVIERALEKLSGATPATYEDVVEVDQIARNFVFDAVNRNTLRLKSIPLTEQ